MSSRPHPSAQWQRLVLRAALLLVIGGSHSAFAQIPNIAQEPRVDRPPNPPAHKKSFTGKQSGKRSGQASSDPSKVSPSAGDKQQAIEQSIAEGNEARDKNDYEHALTSYQKVSKELDPKEARAFYGMGNLFSDLYCYGSAIEAYVNALKLRKDYLEARIGLGYAYIGKERYEDASEQFAEALKLKRNSVEATIGLGIVYAKKGKYQEAVEQINLAINDNSTADKDRAKAHVALGDVYWKQEKWPETIAQYEKAIRLNPDLGKAYLSLGAAQMTFAFSKFATISISELKVQDKGALAASAKQAADNIEKAMSEHSYARPDAYLYLGLALMHQARYQEAVSKVSIYLDKIKQLENQLSSLDRSIASKCDYGFSRFYADGYWYWGFVYLEESLLETNGQRKTDLLNEASEKFKKAIELKEDHPLAYGELGLVYSRQGKYDEAIEQYNKALLFSKEEAGKASLHKSIGVTYLRKGRDAAKLEHYQEAIEQYKKGILEMTEGGDRATLYNEIGLAYMSLKRYDDAVNNMQEAIKNDPNNPTFYEALASVYVTQGNLEETFKWLQKADEVRTAPSTNPDPYFYLGVTYTVRFLRKREEGDFNEAIKWLKKAAEIKKDYAYVYISMGVVYWKHLDADEALRNYNEAVKYDAKDADSYLNMASIYIDLKHNDDAAIGYLKKAIELRPNYAEAYSLLGLVYHHKKDDAEAIKQIQKAIETDPKSLQGYLDMATVYKDRKNFPEAVKYANKAVEIGPDNYRPYRDLGKIYEALQKNAEAIGYYEEALKNLMPDIPWIRGLFLCRIERLRGRYADAVGCFQKLTSFDVPGQINYDLGVTYVASRNKRLALEQYQQLVRIKSPLAEDLLEKINEMK